jgi:uncharacterized protein
MPTRLRLPLRIAIGVLLVFVVFPVGGALVFLKLNESKLVFRTDLSLRWKALPSPTPPGLSEVRLPAPGGEPLHGYTATPDAGRELGYWVLHLHGNADSAFSTGQQRNVQRLRERGFAVLAFDYRGFGPSPGEPSEAALYAGAEAGWQWLLAQGVPPERIIIWGHSLGSGPAVKLATDHRAAALVTFGGFTSIPDMAVSEYPWLPVRWIIGVHLDSLQRIPQVKSPVVIVHTESDAVVPYANAGRLFAAAPAPKRLLTLAMKGNDGLGGHVTELYDQLDLLMPLLQDIAGIGPGATAQ